jgi:hypothetical protein
MSPIAATDVKRSRDVHCTLCKKTYKTKPSLQVHMRTKHRTVSEVYNVQTKKVEAMLTSSLLMKEIVDKVVDDSNKENTGVIEIVDIHTEDEVEVVSPELKEQTDCDECVSGLVHECVDDVHGVVKMNDKKQAVEPNDEWLSKTNTDLSEELSRVDNLVLIEALERTETVEALELMEEVECDECGDIIDSWDSIEDHKYTAHDKVNDKHSSDMNVPYDRLECGECINYKQVEQFKDITIKKGEDVLTKLGAS